MPKACRITDKQKGSVRHHNNHILRYDTEYHEDDPETEEDESLEYDLIPVYCTGHDNVEGEQTTGAGKVYIQGKLAARQGDTGTTNCPCDGQGYTITGGSGKVFIQGKPAARKGDSTDIHGQGTGEITTGASKVYIG